MSSNDGVELKSMTAPPGEGYSNTGFQVSGPFIFNGNNALSNHLGKFLNESSGSY